MNKSYTITYQVVGGKRIDFIVYWVSSLKDAVKRFLAHKMEINELAFTYNEDSIVSITISK